MEKNAVVRWLRQTAAALLLALLCCNAAFAAQDYLIPGGFAVGIELRTHGILISEVKPGSSAAAAGVQKGDTILKINGTAAESIDTLRESVAEGKTVILTVEREEKEAEYLLQPQRCGGEWQLGLMVRDQLAGIGTVTYLDPATGDYGALGHGVSEVGTGRLLPVETGALVPASVASVRKGVRGTPGELRGTFDVTQRLGTVETNTECGIFGVRECLPRTPALPVGTAAEVREGDASILANVAGTDVREYSIRIDRVTADAASGRNLLLTVTDPALLAVTGGIVQGMSGSPILQDGKLIGAVTHVLVNHPEQGYGILIQTMLDAA